MTRFWRCAVAYGLGLPVALLGVGCSAPAVESLEAIVTDSVGVRVVTWDLTDVAPPVFRTVGSPSLTIGVVEGPSEYTFSRIVDLALLPDGAMLVSDANAPGIRLFDREGRFVRSIGGRGEGPGEFAVAPAIAGVSGDTLYAWDGRTGRLTVFTLDGAVVESTAHRAARGQPIRALHLVGDGVFLARSPWADPGAADEFYDFRLELDSVVFERMTPMEGVLDTFDVMPDRNRVRTVRDGGEGQFRVLQAEPPYLARAILEVHAGHVVVGRTDSYEVDVRQPSGGHTRIRVLGVDHPADAGAIRSHIEEELREDFGDDPIDATTRTLYLDYLPERLPAIGAVQIAESGEVWIARSELDDEVGFEWLVFTPGGELKGVVRTPPELRLLAVHEEYVVGVVMDDFDVPFLQRFPLDTPSEEPR